MPNESLQLERCWAMPGGELIGPGAHAHCWAGAAGIRPSWRRSSRRRGSVPICGCALAGAAGAVVGEHKVRNARHDLGTKARAVEDTIVADRRLEPMRFAVRRDIHAKPMRGLGLADA